MLCSSIILLLLPSCLCVTVTLEGGNTGLFAKDLLIGTPGLLSCSYSRGSSGSSPADVQWTYTKTLASGTKKLIYYQNQIQDGYSPQFSPQLPSSLQIQSAVKDNAGFYECRVTIPNDGVGSGTYNLTILIPPSKPACQFTSDYALTIGFSAEFKCHSAEGIPSPMYTWYKNGVALPTSSANNVVYSNTTFSYSMQTGTLTFSKVTKADAGVYYCEAENDSGKSQCNAVDITTKDQDIGMIIGIVFGVIFGLLLIGILIWWTWKKGYCDGFRGGKDDEDGVDGDDANDIMLDGNGPMVKPSSEYNGSTGKRAPDGAVRVMP